jgi:hypothetical protein
MKLFASITLFLIALALSAQPPMPVAPVVTNRVQRANANYIHLPALSPMRYMIASWTSPSPNVAEYEFQLSTNMTDFSSPAMDVFMTGTQKVIDMEQFPNGIARVRCINRQGIWSQWL